MYQYRAEVLKIVDGDTLHARVDLGFDVRADMTLRLYGLDAPELSTPEGVAARDWLTAHLRPGPLVITTYKDKREKYGRYLATLWAGDENLNEAMIAAGHAKPYSGGAR